MSGSGTVAACWCAVGGDERAQANLEPDRYRVTFDDVSMIAPPGLLDARSLRWSHGAPNWQLRG
jgi:hypothetical protein